VSEKEFKNKPSKLIYSNQGDRLEVKVSDIDYQVFYKKKLRINDKRALRELFDDLKRLGADFNVLRKKDW
jgi:hypothetical protein